MVVKINIRVLRFIVVSLKVISLKLIIIGIWIVVMVIKNVVIVVIKMGWLRFMVFRNEIEIGVEILIVFCRILEIVLIGVVIFVVIVNLSCYFGCKRWKVM